MDKNYYNPNADYFQKVPQAPTTINAANLSGQTQDFRLPPPPQTSQFDVNAIPTLADIQQTNTGPTQAETKQTNLSDRLLNLVGSLGGKAQAQSNAEQAVGLPQFQQQLTDANNQIQALQKEAQAIPLQIQQEFRGTGATQGGVAPIQTARLRENSIKALGISAIAQTLQGNVALAQQQAEKAVNLQFEPIQAEIDYLREAINLNKDTLSREEQKRAQNTQMQLNERQRLLDQQKENKGIIYGLAAEAAKLGNAPQAYVNQALALSDPNQALALLSPYLADKNEKAQQIADLEYKRAQTAKVYEEMNISKAELRLKQQKQVQDLKEKVSTSLGSLPVSIQGKVISAAEKFATSDIVKKFNGVADSINVINSIDSNSKNPADHQAVVYAFAKALDPDSAVKEGEYETIKKYAQSATSRYGKEISNALNGTGFLSPQAIQNIQTTMNNLYTSRKPMYDAAFSERSRTINNIAGFDVASDVLSDFSKGVTQQSGQTSTFDQYADVINPAPNGRDAYIPRSAWANVQDKDGLLKYVESLGFKLLVQ